MRRICIAVVMSLSIAHPVLVQEHVREEQIPDLLSDQHAAVELYRQGRTREALAILDRRRSGVHEILAHRIIALVKRPSTALRPWTRPVAASLAALHMEAALRTYERRGSIETFRVQSRLGETLFAGIATSPQAGADPWARWILAIGSMAASDGQRWWAAAILDEGCRKVRTSVELLVACGSAHQAIAALPANVLLLEGRDAEGLERPAFETDSLQEAVAARNRHLAAARRSFDAALREDPTDIEARLRLAHVHFVAGEADRGARLLEGVVKERPTDRRAAFLLHLFLGTIKQHAGELEAAVSSFTQAVDIVPSAQSAHTSLAAALLRSGKPGEAAAVTARMFDAPSQPPDPWTNFHYGQYWVVEPLLAALRSEARQ